MTAAPSSPESDDLKARESFAQKAFADIIGFMNVCICLLGDRLDLFKDLAAHGPATSAELAARTGIVERYAREWLSQMACAEYLGYDPATQRFHLPEAHRTALADEGAPGFLGGIYQNVQTLEQGMFSKLLRAFRDGGGIPYADYDENYWDGLERSLAASTYPFLVEHAIPSLPEVQAALTRGVQVADVGCGRGRLLITLAQAFPASSFVGYDTYAPNIARARANAATAGVADRVGFEHYNVAEGLPAQADLILSVDSLHHAVNIPRVLAVIHAGLAPGGTYLCSEAVVADTLEGNIGPNGAMAYASGVLVCVPTVLAESDEAVGVAGLPPIRMRELSTAAGFSQIRLVSLEGGSFYELRP